MLSSHHFSYLDWLTCNWVAQDSRAIWRGIVDCLVSIIIEILCFFFCKFTSMDGCLGGYDSLSLKQVWATTMIQTPLQYCNGRYCRHLFCCSDCSIQPFQSFWLNPPPSLWSWQVLSKCLQMLQDFQDWCQKIETSTSLWFTHVSIFPLDQV